jgi:hypothetical protein
MAKFLTRQQLYRLLQRELPEDLYADGAPSQYVSTAEMDSVAGVLASAYQTMERVYQNVFVISADEKLNEFENAYFAESTSGLKREERIARILAKIRSTDDISHWQLLTTVGTLLAGTWVEVLQRHVRNDETTAMLRGERLDEVWGPGWSSGDPFPGGVTGFEELRSSQPTLLALRDKAFTYDVLIYSRSINSEVLSLLEKTLREQEPARAAHTVTLLDPALLDFTDAAPNPTRFSDVSSLFFIGPTQETPGQSNIFSRHTLWFGFDDDPFSLGFGDASNSGEEVIELGSPSFGLESTEEGDPDNDGVGFSDVNDANLGGYMVQLKSVGGAFFFLI